MSLVSDADTIEDAPRVALMTVHAAKGLEFSAVFLTGLEQDLFPFKASDPGRNDDIEEERRLAYVAITRARHKLWITPAERRMIFGQTRYGRPSQFLTDLPQAAVAQDATQAARRASSRPSPSMSELARAGRHSGDGPRPAWRHPQARSEPQQPARPAGERYVERDDDHGVRRVTHKQYGAGVVVSMDPGADPIATVNFGRAGVKRIKASFLHFDDDG